MQTANTIKDTRVRVKVNPELLDILKDNKALITQTPKDLRESLKKIGLNLNDAKDTENKVTKSNEINLDLLNEFLSKNDVSPAEANQKGDTKQKAAKTLELRLYLNDLRWLSQFLNSLRADGTVDVYLNDLLETCHLELPQNEMVKRNPVLEARCQRLREEQQNREYRNMTKNVDATLKHYPEDTIAYQMHAMNSQIIAVLQFIFSVAAGFVFGFLGIELIIGNLDFGLRLLLGVMIALIIALAEIYFLAKKLNEYDNTIDTVNKAIDKTTPAKVKHQEPNKKAHQD